ncbi:MAG: APC family permease [Thermaerobacter sp.]|nr:APC family permease [Thermaerobacter sp.]
MKLKWWLFGHPIKSRDIASLKVGVWKGLSVLSPDALSSVAYGSQEILIVLATAGIGALWYSLPISAVIVFLLLFLVISYRQIIQSYPGGGGAYVIGRETFGDTASLLAGSALLIDYTLTVSVSVTAGVSALASAFPGLAPYQVVLSVAMVAVLMGVNLRGVREAAALVGPPTYLFIVMILGMVGVGLFQAHAGAPRVADYWRPPVVRSLGVLIILRAFSSGSSALTGVEAISNGVPLFQEPADRRARRALVLLGLFLGSMFIGTSIIAYRYGIVPNAHMMVLQQLAQAIFGKGIFFYGLAVVTMAILTIAANTSFAGFPQLASIMAHDQWMPRMFMARGDRWVYQNGIIVLGVVASLLIIVFGGNTNRLIPLYAIGVYMSFTVAMLSLVKKHLGEPRPHGRQTFAILVGLIGALLTATVVAISIVTKFAEGAWIVVLAIPLLIWSFHRVKRHYQKVSATLRVADQPATLTPHPLVVVVPIRRVNRMSQDTLEYALSISAEVVAVTVVFSKEEESLRREEWKVWDPDPRVKLVVLVSQYRSVLRPLLHFIDHLTRNEASDKRVMVLIAELVVEHFWQNLLHNQMGVTLEASLVFRKNVVVAMVPYRMAPMK